VGARSPRYNRSMKVLGIAGYSGSGKTTLIEKLIAELSRRGQRVGVLKHAHHAFDIDRPGKDSYRARVAGAAEVLVASANRWALMHELHGQPELNLDELLAKFTGCDLVLVEGYKRAGIDKIEVHRAAAGTPLLYPNDGRVIAIATDRRLATSLPQIDINNTLQLADFIENRFFDTATKELRLKAVKA
jgi:molybdopterin-guanine dinucleotide biosynthesis adapter protein